jgi:3-hydroxyacyl-CoA dehydrogenase
MEIHEVGVLGSGTMGSGIGQVLSQAGFPVVLLDVSEDVVKRGFERIEGSLSRSVEKGRLSLKEKEESLKRIRLTMNVEELKDADLIIEAVVEDLGSKVELFRRLNDLCPHETVFASNTSTLSITQIARSVSRPDRFLGLHFFNPVPSMRLVEVVRGLQTSDKTVQVGMNFVNKIKKVPVPVSDCPGFLVNRIFMPYAGEAMFAAQEGAASPLEIDESVRKFGFPMGPLVLNDMVGIDVGCHTFPRLHEVYGERFPVPLLFERLFKVGRFGSKVGKGIYVDRNVDKEFLEITRGIQKETGIRNTEFSVERLVLRQVNEAICCLQEKIATAEDIDRAMVLGTGFPSDEKGVGGPLHWADQMGLDWVLERLEHFKKTLGSRFLPHFLLKQYVAAGYLGTKANKGFFEY